MTMQREDAVDLLQLRTDEPVAFIEIEQPITGVSRFLSAPLRTVGRNTALTLRTILEMDTERVVVKVTGPQTAAECRRKTPTEPPLSMRYDHARPYYDYWRSHEHVYTPLEELGNVCRHCLCGGGYVEHV